MKELKVIIVYMSKGGVGKTTATSILAYEMAKYGKTLMIDADQQGDLTSLFFEDFSKIKKGDFCSVLKEEIKLKDAIIDCRADDEESKDLKGLWILGTEKNSQLLKPYIEGQFRDSPYTINSIIESAKELDFEYVFIDLPPSIGFYEKIMLSCANEIIPIVQPEEFAIASLANFNKLTKTLKTQLRASFEKIKYLILNYCDKSIKTHAFWMESLKESPFEVYEFNRSKSVSSATSMHKTLQEQDKSNKICKTVAELALKLKKDGE